uniref:SQUAMOSA promoter-binding-like 4 n=1 Tax=Erycina pusilla TaxID=154679 RepID=M9QR39_9ASPA|nr:SQUAMOSA promoter-binding-like 4 [Erycina pusilla]
MVTSFGASRRNRFSSSNGHIATCSVDGCVADLSKCREYHKRHKVCEVHSKTPIVMVGGREQRFCQQCSRFHSLSEFDEGKRSCRKRLDGHNRRRRKPQVDNTILNPGNSLTNHQGTINSSHQQIYPTNIPDSNWINFSAKSEQRTIHSHCLPLQFPFLQQNEAIHDSDCAFSLLSSSSSAQSSHINLNPNMYKDDKILSKQALQMCNNGAELYPYFHSCVCESVTTMKCVQTGNENNVSNNGADLHCQNVFEDNKVLFHGASENPSSHWQWDLSQGSDSII